MVKKELPFEAIERNSGHSAFKMYGKICVSEQRTFGL